MTRYASTDLIEDWLSGGPQVAPDGLRRAVSAQVDRTRQQAQLSWRSPALLLPMGIAVILAAALAFQVVGPNVGETPETTGSSTLLRDWPNQPEWFVNRDQLPFCGESRTGAQFDPDDDHDTAGRQCLFDAYRHGGSGEWVSVVDMDDRRRLLTVTRVLGEGRIEFISAVSFVDGAQRPWHQFECTRLAEPWQLAEETGRSMSQSQAAAIVFEVDQRSCSSTDEPQEPGPVGSSHAFDAADRLQAFMYESVWFTNAESGTLKRVDPYSGVTISEVDLGEWLLDEPATLMAAGSSSLWLAAGNELVEIDPHTGGAAGNVTLDGPVASLVVHGDRVWATVGGEQVVAVSVFDHTAVHRIELPGASGVAADGAWVWANSAEDDGLLIQIHPWSGATVSEHRIGSGVHRLHLHGEVLYGLPARLSTTGEISVVRYEPETADLLRVARTPDAGGDPAVLASFFGELWAGFPDGTIARLDTGSLGIVGPARIGDVGEEVRDLLSADASLWAMGYGLDPTLYRIDPAPNP